MVEQEYFLLIRVFRRANIDKTSSYSENKKKDEIKIPV
jgi:hypothetical protein